MAASPGGGSSGNRCAGKRYKTTEKHGQYTPCCINPDAIRYPEKAQFVNLREQRSYPDIEPIGSTLGSIAPKTRAAGKTLSKRTMRTNRRSRIAKWICRQKW
jgi:hypothetical protein